MKQLMKWAEASAKVSRAFVPAGAFALLALVAGCATAPDHYYTLAVPMGSAASPVTPANATPVYTELAPLVLPERLARPQMLVRRQGAGSSAQVDVLEQHRWSSSFENELRDALANGIASQLGGIDVTKGGKPAGRPVWRIAVQVRQFDAVENSRVDADLVWTLKRSDKDRVVTCQWAASEPVGATSGIDGVAQASQRMTTRAAEAVGKDVAALQADPMSACRSAQS